MICRRVTILGCGYVGTALGAELVRRGVHCVGTTTSQAGHSRLLEAGIEPATVDLDDARTLARTIADSDALVLAVAPGRSCRTYQSVYLDGARHLVAALAHDTTVRRLVYTSSSRVFGHCSGAWVDEKTLACPVDDEGYILLETERTLLNCSARNLSTTVLRLSGIYGPGRDPAQRAAGFAGTERADGHVWLNLVHRDDIVATLVRLMDIDHHGVLHLSDDTPTTRRDYYDRLVTSAGLAPIKWTTDDTIDAGKRICNTTIKKLLDLQLRHPNH